MTANKLTLWGLANLWKEGKEGGYPVRHGLHPVQDFWLQQPSEEGSNENDGDTPNFFEKAFPCLFPYGEGRIEGTQPIVVEFAEQHIKWALCYHDRRFRRHETFPFVAFGIQQWRQGLLSAWIQMQWCTFEHDAHLLSTITVAKLQQAQQEEEARKPISDPAVRLLHWHIYATSGRMMGSDQGRSQLRTQIWSTCIMLNPPSLWIMINPCNLHDPIAQVFASEHIDLDKFNSMLGPSKEKRTENVASDPYAAAKFFHFTIQTILQTLFRVTIGAHKILSSKGIFGHVAAYFSIVESQAWATLHLHVMLWLIEAPSMEEMKTLLTDEQFREHWKGVEGVGLLLPQVRCVQPRGFWRSGRAPRG